MKQLTDLAKLYADDDMKYGGELYDVLDDKLRIFYNCCKRLAVSEWQYTAALSTMLKGRALTYYYKKICANGTTPNFNMMSESIWANFETEECRQLYLGELRSTTLPTIFANNGGKSKIECLELLFDKLTTL